MPEKLKSKKKRMVFSLDAPEAREVLLLGTFNMWDRKKHPMKKKDDGIWEKTVVVPKGRYEYKFLVDGKWCHDPANQEICYNEHGTHNSIIVVN